MHDEQAHLWRLTLSHNDERAHDPKVLARLQIELLGGVAAA